MLLIMKLQEVFSKSLNDVKTPWHLELDPDDVDGESLLFHYPSPNANQNNNYIRRVIKIELGSRGGREPTSVATITPFIEELIPNTLSEPNIQIKTLAAERTFWEKATILHMYSQWPENKKLAERQSRHFFDFYKLLQSQVKGSASNAPNLLQKVAMHKKVYFRAGWANYDTAIQGKLQLMPAPNILNLLKNDYNRMQDMFYGEPVAWNDIIAEIANFQREFNEV